jgi:hypothetical protein
LGKDLAAIKVYISDEVERKFRETAMKLYGYGKGSLSIASEKALSQWVSNMYEVIEIVDTIEDPLDAISGLLKGIDTDGVELQHAAANIRKGEARGK